MARSRLAAKSTSGVLVGGTISKLYVTWEFGTLQEKKQLLQHVGALAERVYEEAKNSIQRQLSEAKRTGKQEELIEEWKTRLLLELGTLAIGAGELRGASAAARELKIGQILEDNRMLKLTESVEAAKVEILPAKRVVSEEALLGSTEGIDRKELPKNFNDQPIFDSLHDVELPDELVGPEVSDDKQMRFATKELKRYLRDNPEAWNNFTKEQQAALRDALGDMNSDGVKSVRIKGFTWNHNDMDVGKLQLVDRAEHADSANYHEGAGTAGWVKR